MAMYLPAMTRSSAVVAAVPPAAGLGGAELRGGVLAGAVVWAGVPLLAQPAASRMVPSSTVPTVTRLVAAACPCMSVTLPPDMDTSMIGRWLIRLTINSWTPWSQPG